MGKNIQAALHFFIGLTPRSWRPNFIPQELHVDDESAQCRQSAPSATITHVKISLRQPASAPGLLFTMESLDAEEWLSSRRRRLNYRLLSFLARRWPSLSPWESVFPYPLRLPAGLPYAIFQLPSLPEPIHLVQRLTYRFRIIEAGCDLPGAGLQINTYITKQDCGGAKASGKNVEVPAG